MKIEYYKNQELFHNLFFIEEVEPIRKKERTAVFLCGYCNSLFTSVIKTIKDGHRKSCGCVKTKMLQDRKYSFFTKGDVFGKCTFIEYSEVKVDKRNIRHYLGKFVCECGKEFIASCSRVKNGYKQSCGCFHNRPSKHKLSQTPEYRIWVGMKIRCVNPKCISYPNYGGRGITVCERWLDKKNGFLNFYEDMRERPSDKHSIDRIDVNGNYEPNNCRWADRQTQERNKRTNHKIIYKGVTKCISEWALELNIHPETLRYRLRNWAEDKVFIIKN